MDEKTKKDNTIKANKRINQFIIECLFNKYFEEKENEVVAEKIEIASSAFSREAKPHLAGQASS